MMPPIALSSVLLPEPLGPMSPTVVPAAIETLDVAQRPEVLAVLLARARR